MDQEIARKWVKALRSGEYKQGRGRLRNRDRFCCLGVLCNLHAQAHPKIASEQLNTTSYLGEEYALPSIVMNWVGVSSPNRLLHYRGGGLATMNDTGASFDQIAQVIADHWREL